MSYLVANFGDSAKDKREFAVPLADIASLQPVAGKQVRINFKNDVSGHNDFIVYAKGDLQELCISFTNAQRNGNNIDATEITQGSPFKPGAKVGEITLFS